MEFQKFVRKPFVVEAIEITTENIGEIAKHVGELKAKGDGTPFILVDRKLVPSVYRVFPGYFFTRMGDHLRCYTPKLFAEQFTKLTPQLSTWVEFVNAGEPDLLFEHPDAKTFVEVAVES